MLVYYTGGSESGSRPREGPETNQWVAGEEEGEGEGERGGRRRRRRRSWGLGSWAAKTCNTCLETRTLTCWLTLVPTIAHTLSVHSNAMMAALKSNNRMWYSSLQMQCSDNSWMCYSCYSVQLVVLIPNKEFALPTAESTTGRGTTNSGLSSSK